MAGELLLITGVSGHVGFRVLAEALQAGYRARAVVRRAEQATKIKATKSISPYADKVEFAVIPDLSVDGAFDAHTNGVSYILHVAAQQFTSVDVPIDVAEFAKSNIKFTENILEAAAKAPSVKRVLITSSVTTLFTGEGLQGDSDLVLSWKSEVAKDLISPAPEKAVGPIAYVISKVLSAKLVEKFVEERKPHFTVASILLGTTIGRFELASESKELVSGSNIVPLAPLLVAHQGPHHRHRPGTVRKIVPVYNTATNPDAFTWDDSIEIVKKHFPGVIESGAFPLGGTVPKRKCLVDSSEDEKVLGLKFKTYEEAVVDLITQFLTLAQAAQAAAAASA
ncbi:hypothetical protein NLJ89_g5463 [Agrocybe chaxingu]|uniref:NAD-dependent epimerase/dehydratase domain-containing protein n=1 Tax=Agrocybe chaxingu TaxID=84603 RepID=A0A9W8K2B7_9AGAR|nr:hypothetical protein NLJ89_g5463 [Agrocybe chaxingu]